MEGYPVLITTKHRGVFFGYSDVPASDIGRTVVLRNIRNCLYWSKEIGGFLGLAKLGPSNLCKIGTFADEAKMFDVTSATTVSAEAETKWNDA